MCIAYSARGHVDFEKNEYETWESWQIIENMAT
jgi:hypothetical protein